MPDIYQTTGEDGTYLRIGNADERENGTRHVAHLQIGDAYDVAAVILERHELLELATWCVNRYNETEENNE